MIRSRFLTVACFLILGAASVPTSAAGFEAGSGTIAATSGGNPAFTTFSFNGSFTTTPVVVAIGDSTGGNPCNIRIQSVTTTDFSAACLEPIGEDGPHLPVPIDWIAVEPGSFTVPLTGGGFLVLNAGTVSTTAIQHSSNLTDAACGVPSFVQVAFDSAFSANLNGPPTVLTEIQTLANEVGTNANQTTSPLLTTISSGITTTGFSVALERSESCADPINSPESIGWIATEVSGCATIDLGGGATVLFEAATTAAVVDGWSDGCNNNEGLNFTCSFGASPLVVANKASQVEDDGGWLRQCSVNSTRVRFTVDEDRSFDNERNHAAEAAAVFAVERAFSLDIPTLATLADLGLVEGPNATYVEFKTSSEAATAGFHLGRLSENGTKIRLTEQLIPSALEPGGATYRWRVPAGLNLAYAQLIIEELELDGDKIEHGPFLPRLSVTGDATDLRYGSGTPNMPTRNLRPTSGSPVERDPQRVSIPTGQRPQALVITPQTSGVQRIPFATIGHGFGISEAEVRSAVEAGRLNLEQGHQEVAWTPASSRGSILFYAQPSGNLYTTAKGYRLTLASGTPMQTSTRIPRADHPTSVTVVKRHERQSVPLLAIGHPIGDDFWFEKVLGGGRPDGADRLAVPIDIVGLRPGTEALIEVDLVGAFGRLGQHQDEVELRLNGQFLTQVSWPSRTRTTVRTAVAAEDLVPESTLEIVAVDLLPRQNYVAVDFVEVTGEIAPVIQETPLQFTASGPQLAIANADAARPNLLLDITDQRHPTRILTHVSANGLITARTVPGREYVLLYEDAADATAEVRAMTNSRLAEQALGWSHLVIGPERFSSTAQRLVDLRNQLGTQSRFVSLNEIYDHFGDGTANPLTIRAFLEAASTQWETKPKVVVLAASGHFDYHDRLGTGVPPLPPVLAPFADGTFSTDAYLGDFDSDGKPEVVVGRIPAPTESALDHVISKIVAYESRLLEGSLEPSALLIAGDPGNGGNFPVAIRRQASELGAAWSTTTLDSHLVGGAAAQAQLLTELENDLTLFSFAGHGDLNRLGRDPILTIADVASLPTTPTQPIALALACMINRFELPWYLGLGSELVLAPSRGAVAVLAPSATSTHDQSRPLGELWAREIGEGSTTTLAEAWNLVAKQARSNPIGVGREALWSMTLMGDPGLSIPRTPRSF